MAEGTNELSAWYVSGKEATVGASAAMTQRFLAVSNTVVQQEAVVDRPGVTGYENAKELVQTSLKSGGSISDSLYPAVMNWLGRHMFGAAATNASAGASNTAYTHTWAAITNPPSTFSMIKQLAGISGATELLTGLGITAVTVKSVDGIVTVDATVEGLGSVYTVGVTVPSIDPLETVDQAVMTGNMTSLLVDDVSVTNTLRPDWSVSIKLGRGVIPSAGSSDGSYTRFGKMGKREITASCGIYITDGALLTKFKAKTVNKYTFRCTGPVIDAVNGISSGVDLIIPAARIVGSINATIQGDGSYFLPLNLKGWIAPVGNALAGYDFSMKTTDLVAAP